MSPLLQTVVAIAVVLVAIAYVGRRVWVTMAKARRARAGGSCSDGCCK